MDSETMLAGVGHLFCIAFILWGVPHLPEPAIGQVIEDGDPAEVNCQQRLMEEVYICVSSRDIDFNIFLVLVSDTSSNTDPSGNTTQPPLIEDSNTTTEEFREKLCGARDTVMRCIFDTAKKLMSLPACSKPAPGQGGNVFNQDLLINDQRYLIKEQMEAIVGQYDVFCAHPCRISLLDDMRACYSQHDLDSKLFMSTDSSGPVIGDSSYDVNLFCSNRQSIVGCLKETRDDCEESQLVLGAIGLDLDFMERGFKVLCDNNETYLDSLDCFESHTPEVGYCHSIKYRGIITIAKKAQEHKWSEEKYFEEICQVILRHIQCDLEAWGKKAEEDCSKATLGLKRKLHCTLIPKQCLKSQSSSIAEVCTPQFLSSAAINSQHWIFPHFISAALLVNLLCFVYDCSYRS